MQKMALPIFREILKYLWGKKQVSEYVVFYFFELQIKF